MKRTALGRFKHENATAALAADNRVVVYMGDDERGEFMYRWVSREPFEDGGGTSTLLTDGQLYVAKFNDDMTGEWVALTPRQPAWKPPRSQFSLAPPPQPSTPRQWTVRNGSPSIRRRSRPIAA